MNERSVMPVPACGLLVADLEISAQTSEQHEVADHEPARPAVMFRTLTTRSDASTLTRGMSHRAATIPTVRVAILFLVHPFSVIAFSNLP